MKQIQSKQKLTVWNSIIILLSIAGLIVCVPVLFPQVRCMILDYVMQVFHRETIMYESWSKVLLSFSMGGICLILLFNYCVLTGSGRTLVKKVKQDIIACLSEIDFRPLLKPVLIMSGIYLLGILAIIRADFSYMDDIWHSVNGGRAWYNWSRYVTMLLTYIIHPEIRITDNSPLPQLLTVVILACSSVLLVYITGNRKITTVRLLASIPLGLSPYFLECLSYKFDAPYMALSVISGIIPFLFIARKKAFIFCSVIALLIMCMTYQAASGIYLLIVILLCFQDWNNRSKSNKEIMSFLCTAALAFCIAMLIFKIFIMRTVGTYVSNEMYTASQLISGILNNIKNYVIIINGDLGVIWKAGIALVVLFFITKSIVQSSQKKLYSFLMSVAVIGILFILSYGIYLLLARPLFTPRGMLGFGAFLSIICIYVVSNYKKTAIIAVLALNWCFFVFAFSYGNALADQKRYAEFRVTLLLHDLSSIQFNRNIEDTSIQLQNSIGFAPTVKNISKNYPVIEKLVHIRLGMETDMHYNGVYFRIHFDYNCKTNISWMEGYTDYRTLDLPVVIDSYYHTIQSDGERVLVTLKR